MNTNFAQWVEARKLKESNLGDISASGFQDMTGDEADEAGVKKQFHQPPLRQMYGQKKRPEVFVNPSTLDQLAGHEEDHDDRIDNPHLYGDESDWDHHHSDVMGNHDVSYDPENPMDNPAGIPDGQDVHTPPSTPYRHVTPEATPLRRFLHPESPNVAAGYDTQAALEQPMLTKKQMRELNKGKMEKAIKSWKEYKRARKAQSHAMGTPTAGQGAIVDPRATGAELRRFGGTDGIGRIQ